MARLDNQTLGIVIMTPAARRCLSTTLTRAQHTFFFMNERVFLFQVGVKIYIVETKEYFL